MADRAEPEISLGPADNAKPEVSSDAKSAEILTPMLEVHAPHEALHTWKGFFIHIATIVIGLLIAIGLEQTVEHFHHERQVATTRKALQLELALNVDRFAAETELARRYVPILQTNLAVFQYLKLHPGAAATQWPGVLSWHSFDPLYWTNAWETAKQSGVLSYMPEGELRRYAAIYRRLEVLADAKRSSTSAACRATAYLIAQPNASLLSPSQLDEQVALTASLLNTYLETAYLQRAIAAQIREFSQAPTAADIEAITHQPEDAEATKAVDAIVNKFLEHERELAEYGAQP